MRAVPQVLGLTVDSPWEARGTHANSAAASYGDLFADVVFLARRCRPHAQDSSQLSPRPSLVLAISSVVAEGGTTDLRWVLGTTCGRIHVTCYIFNFRTRNVQIAVASVRSQPFECGIRV